jgi:small subunit ribosomal protein S1
MNPTTSQLAASKIRMTTSGKKNMSPFAQFVKSEMNRMPLVREGDLVEGTLIHTAPKAAYFDLGQLGTGVVYGIEYINADSIIKKLSQGDAISAKVVESENHDGYIELSLSEAGKQKAWQAIKDLKDQGEALTVKIAGANWGGLLTEVENIKAFIPVSQLSNEHYPRVEDGNREKISEELQKFVGEELVVKVIDFKPRVNKLILSEKEGSEVSMKELLGDYEVGQIIDGIISGVADFGAFVKFVDNPNIEGLIHISELDHRLIENPKEVVAVNDAVQAKIIEIKEGRVSLSLKALKADPWATVADTYKVGNEISGTVIRFNPFGAFIGLSDDIQGLIHVSEFGGVEEMKAVLVLHNQYQFTIELVKPEEKRIILKLKK